MKKYYMEFVLRNDEVVGNELRNTDLDPESEFCGGVYDADGIIEPNHVIGNLLKYSSAYFCGDSSYYRSPALYDAMMKSYDYIEKVQRPDGTIDFLRSNFYAAPGFEMHSLGRAYKIIDKYSENDDDLILRKRHYDVLKKIVRGLYNGGFHTPNHRWVDTAGLALGYNITGEEDLKEKALRYLAEGIDIDEYGDFAERSPGIYNAVVDNALFIVAEELDMPELYEHIDRNMQLLYSYLEPDGTIFTQNSTRQDKGEGAAGRNFYPANYFHIYLKGARVYNSDQYAAFADWIIKETKRAGRGLPNVLWFYLIEDWAREADFGYKPVPVSYENFLEKTNLVRWRNGDVSAAVLGNNANFLFVQKGALRCYARMSSSFFAVAQFRPGKIDRTDTGYHMAFTAHGSYKKPFDVPPETSDWFEMDHSKRRICNEVELTYDVNVSFIENGVKLDIRTSGCDRVPFKIEFCFTPGSKVINDNFIIHAAAGGYVNVKNGDVTVRKGNDSISVGPAFSSHDYTHNLRGSVPKSSTDFTVYFTGFTPVEKTIEISCE